MASAPLMRQATNQPTETRLMMDIYCPRCGEPVELDYLHDVADDRETTFDHVREQFFTRGCRALGGRCNPRRDHERAEASATLFDILGADVDGIACMMEDLGL